MECGEKTCKITSGGRRAASATREVQSATWNELAMFEIGFLQASLSTSGRK